MKKFKSLFCVALFAMALFCVENINAQQKEGVTINGVTWATTNVGATTIEGNGSYYTWEQAKTACPKGWRLPTMKELEMFQNVVPSEEDFGVYDIEAKVPSTWTTLNGKNGRHFTDKVTGNNIFMPAAGYRYDNDGTLNYVGTYGFYWSSTEYSSTHAYYLSFRSGSVGLYNYYNNFSFSVRCVAE